MKTTQATYGFYASVILQNTAKWPEYWSTMAAA